MTKKSNNLINNYDGIIICTENNDKFLPKGKFVTTDETHKNPEGVQHFQPWVKPVAKMVRKNGFGMCFWYKNHDKIGKRRTSSYKSNKKMSYTKE